MASIVDIVRRITISAAASGVDATTASLSKLAGAQGAVTIASVNSEKATLSAATKLNALQKAVDGAYASEMRMAQAEKTLTLAESQGLITAERKVELLGLAKDKYAEAGAAAELMAKGEDIAAEAGRGLLASLGPLVALTALAELPNKIMETAESVSKIGENAETIGITTKQLQELDFAATQTGVSTDTMNSALERFTKNIGLAQTGSGQLAKILKANGIGISGDTTKDLESFANLIERATTAEQRNYLITTAFGKGASELGPFFRDGADGIQALIDKADDANVVLSDGTITSAHALNQEFQSLEAQLNSTFEEFIINIAPTLEQALQDITQLVRAANQAVDASKVIGLTVMNADKAIGDQSTDYLNQDLANKQKLLASAQKAMSGNGGFIDTINAGLGGNKIPGYQQGIAADQGELAKRGAVDLDSFVSGNSGMNGGWGKLPPPLKLPPPPKGAGAKRDPFSEIEQSAKSQIDALKAQAEALGQSGLAADKLTEQTKLLSEATKDHITLTAKQRAALIEDANGYAEAKDNLAKLTSAYDTGKQAFTGFFSTMISGAEKGESFMQSFGDATKKMIDDLLLKAEDAVANDAWNSLWGGLTGGSSGTTGASSNSGGLFGWLASALGVGSPTLNPGAGLAWAGLSANAKGGVYSSRDLSAYRNSVVDSPTHFRFAKGGVMGEMGEAGPEAIMPLKKGPDGRLGVSGGGGGTVHIENHYHLDGAISDKGVQRIAQQIADQNSALLERHVRKSLPGWNAKIRSNASIA